MNHIAAALLLSLAGKSIDKKGIEDILTAAGSKANPLIVENIIAATKGKKPDQIISEGLPKLASTAGVSSAPVEAKVEAKAEEKKDDKKGAADKKGAPAKKDEKKKVEVVEDDEDGGMMGLF